MIQIRPYINLTEDDKDSNIQIWVNGESDYIYANYEAFYMTDEQIVEDIVARVVKLYDAIPTRVKIRFTDEKSEKILKRLLELKGCEIHHLNKGGD